MVEKEVQLRSLAKIYMAAHFPRLVQTLQQASLWDQTSSVSKMMLSYKWFPQYEKPINYFSSNGTKGKSRENNACLLCETEGGIYIIYWNDWPHQYQSN